MRKKILLFAVTWFALAVDGMTFSHGPYLQNPSSTSMTVFFDTSSKALSWVEVKSDDDGTVRCCYAVKDGLRMAYNTHNAITVDGLAPATTYSYRIVSKEMKKFAPYEITYGETITSDWYTFSTLDPQAEQLDLVVLNDCHEEPDKVKKLLNTFSLEEADMVVYNGDMVNYVEDINTLYWAFIDPSVSLFAKNKPFIYARGNHETRGNNAREFRHYVGTPNDRFYNSYYVGNTALIVLDTGEDKLDTHDVYAGTVAFDEYRTEQAAWLAKEIETEAFLSAEHRIVIMHSPPVAVGDLSLKQEHDAEETINKFLPVLNKADIDVSLSGHMREFWYHRPGERDNNFPVVIADNNSVTQVKVSEKGISVQVVNTAGVTLLDEFFHDDHHYVNGICTVCGHANKKYKLLKNGQYELGNDKDLLWFSALMSDDNTANAKLTADIDLSGVDYTPIGSMANPYAGTFDGGCHTISGMKVKGYWFQGLFGILGEGAEACNLIIDETCSVEAKVGAGAFAGATLGNGVITIRNCGTFATVTVSEDNAAAFVATNFLGEAALKFYNSFNAGRVNCLSDSRNSAVFCSWFGAGSEIKNCYHAGTIDADCVEAGMELYRKANKVAVAERLFTTQQDVTQGQLITEEDAENGHLAYLLNDQTSGGDCFYQTFGADKYPVPFSTHERVYVKGKLTCDGKPVADTLLFTNEKAESERAEHHFEQGFCTVCGAADPTYIEVVDGVFQIAREDQFRWFATYATETDPMANGRLLCDMQLGDTLWPPIGSKSKPYMGSFDGGCHTISGMKVEAPKRDSQGLFGTVAGGATITGVFVDSTCSVEGNQYVGAIVGCTRGTGTVYISRCGSEAAVTCAKGYAAGIVGANLESETTVSISNCFNAGTISCAKKSTTNASICAYTKGQVTVTHCYHIGTVENVQEGRVLYRNEAEVEGTDNYTTRGISTQGTIVSEDDVTSGHLAYLLNDEENGGTNYYQTLGHDRYPVPFNTHAPIYRVEDGTYTNTPSGVVSEEVSLSDANEIYSPNGIRQSRLQSGVNIIRRGGSTVKVLGYPQL